MHEYFGDYQDPEILEYCEFCDAYCTEPCESFEEARERCAEDPFTF